MTGQPRDIDILGLKPVARAVEKSTDAAIAGAAAFLSLICRPAAEEFGFLLRDQVSHWRARNAARIAAGAETKLDAGDHEKVRAHPRIVAQLIEHGSWDDDEQMQEMWAGLLASSCQEGEASDENLIFVDLLSRITSSEARLLRLVCQRAPKFHAAGGELVADGAKVSVEDLAELIGLADRTRQYREIAHLQSLGLLRGGFGTSTTAAHLAPSELGLHFVARCSGYRGDPSVYFNVAAV